MNDSQQLLFLSFFICKYAKYRHRKIEEILCSGLLFCADHSKEAPISLKNSNRYSFHDLFGRGSRYVRNLCNFAKTSLRRNHALGRNEFFYNLISLDGFLKVHYAIALFEFHFKLCTNFRNMKLTLVMLLEYLPIIQRMVSEIQFQIYRFQIRMNTLLEFLLKNSKDHDRNPLR